MPPTTLEHAKAPSAPVTEDGERHESIEPLSESDRARYEFAEALCATPEEVERLRPHLRQLVDNAIAATGDAQLQNTLRTYLGVMEYRLFGQPGEPLPPGIAFIGTPDNPEIGHDFAAGYCYNCGAEAERAIGGRGTIQAIEDELLESKRARQPEIEAAAVTFVRTMTSYKMLESMGTEIADAPPYSADRLFKENELRERVERKNGARIEDLTPRGYMAKQEYFDGLNRLDLEEEMQRAHDTKAKQSKRYPLHLAKSRLSQMAAGGKRIVASPREASGYLTVEVDGHKMLAFNLGQDVLSKSRLADAAPLLERRMTYELFGQVYDIVLDPEFKGTYQDALNEAAVRTAHKFVSKRLGTNADKFGTHYSYRQPAYELRMPPTPILSEEENNRFQADHDRWHYEINKTRTADNAVSFVSHEEKERQEKTVIGRIHSYTDTSGAQRLIQQVDAMPPADFHTEDAHESLMISLRTSEFGGRPYIPGYRLTSAKHGGDAITYGFEKDPDGDPYTRADMLIPEHARLELAKTYEHIGLHTLADAMRATTHMRVADLVELVRGETYYPTVKARERHKLPADFVPQRLEDFAVIVRNKSLWAQCSGSSPFLALSLQACGFEAGTMAGTSLKPTDKNIRGTRHAQTYMNHNGRRYILDATGSLSSAQKLRRLASSVGKSVGEHIRVFRRVGRPQAAAPAATHVPEILPIEALPPKEAQRGGRLHEEALLQEELRTISHSLETSLAPLFGATTPAGLMKALGSRPEGIRANIKRGNPVDRVIAAARRAVNNAIEPEELAALSRFLKGYASKQNLVASHDLPKYDVSVMNMLEGYVLQIRRAIEQRQHRFTPAAV